MRLCSGLVWQARDYDKMTRFLLLFVLPVAAAIIFFSGSFPYTLIYDEESLMEVKFDGKEPVSAEVVQCEIQDTADLMVGEVLETTFRARLRNHTDRFVVISAIGEVFSPRIRSSGMHSQLFILNPNTVEETVFRTNTTYTSTGSYRCEMRYAIGRFKY